MDAFHYADGELKAEGVSLAALAGCYGTPLYVYSRAALMERCRAFEEALAAHRRHLVCFAVKANGSLALLNLLARAGTGFDVVSGGELLRVLAAGGDPGKVVFSGVGKTASEMELGLRHGIRCFNVESEGELELLSATAAALGLEARISLRVNPDVDAKTHPAITTGLRTSKFGIPMERAFDLYLKASRLPGLRLAGVDCHIGSQMTSSKPAEEALDKLLELYFRLKAQGIGLEHIDIGGGLGVTYMDETPPEPAEYYRGIVSRLNDVDAELIIEPGRAMVAGAGVLLTRVLYLKHNGSKNFCVVDGSMADLIRPALYDARMRIVSCREPAADSMQSVCDVVGPVCESDDFLGHDRRLEVKTGDVLAVLGAGAYGRAMASHYNSRPLCAEVLVDGDREYLIREREEPAELWRHDRLIS